MAAFDSSVNDPYISHLLSTSSSLRAPRSLLSKMSSAPASSGAVPNLIQFLESVPPPITLLLVQLAPTISWLRWATEIVSWKSHWTDPWLALAAWWVLCLSTKAVLRYLLPLAFLLPALLPYLHFRRTTLPKTAPTTEHSISLSLSDISIFHSLLPALPPPPTVPFATALRLSALLFLPYVILTHFVPMSILIGLAGTLLLTYRSPWARTIRSVLWRSAYVRRFLLQLWCFLSGSVSSAFTSSTAGASRTKTQMPSLSTPVSPPVRFLFTILECQRWWMGLDWTGALLPGERPSWCGTSLQPVPPPSAFSLPPPTSVFLAVPNGKRVKRTATWRWEEGEWGVLVNKEGTGTKRVEKKPPGIEVEEGGARIATRAASILKERKASMGSNTDMSPGKDERDSNAGVSAGSNSDHDGGEDHVTDPEGWVFGDNKWETPSAKGGMGKYTRYRRWTRIAVLEETVEEVGPGEVGVVKPKEDRSEEGGPPPEETESLTRNVTVSSQSEPERSKASGDGDERGSGLKQRLKIAVKGGAPNHS